MFFEQDGVSSHKSKKIKKLLEELFGDNLIQTGESTPDIAYPIETLWAELKKKSKKISIDEWNKIPKSFIQNLFKNFIKRCKKIIELNGGRLEPVHLKQIRKEAEIEEKEEKEEKERIDADEKEVIENSESKKLKLKIIYNKNELFQKAKKKYVNSKKNQRKKKRN